MPKRTKENVGHQMDTWVGKRMRQRRQHLGISAAAVARQLDVQRQSVDKWETGEMRMSVGQLYEVALILQVAPGWFYEGHPVNNTSEHRPRELDMLLQIPDATPLLLHYSRLDETQRAAAVVLIEAAGRGQPQSLDGKGKPLVPIDDPDGDDDGNTDDQPAA